MTERYQVFVYNETIIGDHVYAPGWYSVSGIHDRKVAEGYARFLRKLRPDAKYEVRPV